MTSLSAFEMSRGPETLISKMHDPFAFKMLNPTFSTNAAATKSKKFNEKIHKAISQWNISALSRTVDY